ncbi:hypothetical protein BG74_00475 [Sodalis-like endosymbiont of Proechinophthirus fluctus]|uniref:hypothetical protein n=1 Tax=Sodalis-like endosymbiont of Proechinophthirus fluctus TaxID=1462730 RepID=UPI0007A7C4A8|nr:hypothetical protein [Sodalis-like endosymbiont of Proechinophthirus fluctus]KYP97769.1 hypothetical protein BG74_00475 [Sodalis-like endosymbiont of Proechinophthirus fluctus]
MKKTTFALLLALFSPSFWLPPDGNFHPDKKPYFDQTGENHARWRLGNAEREYSSLVWQGNYEFHDKTSSLVLHIAPDDWHGDGYPPTISLSLVVDCIKARRGCRWRFEQLQKQ